MYLNVRREDWFSLYRERNMGGGGGGERRERKQKKERKEGREGRTQPQTQRNPVALLPSPASAFVKGHCVPWVSAPSCDG